jgi:hypothetical protein
MVLRLVIAPVYLDSELGLRQALGENTDLGVGLSGGGFADSYYEIDRGVFIQEQSFTGHGGGVEASVYHRFNPDQKVPLNGILRVLPYYTAYERDSETSPFFVLPNNHATLHLRSGLRLGGSEPVLHPAVAMELSGWYEGQWRSDSGPYGFNGDREMQEACQLFWGRALFIYTLPKARHRISLSLTGGSGIKVDRLSAYRLGGYLPFSSEFPLLLPGYYYQEISARDFVEFLGEYSLPLGAHKRWSVNAVGAVAGVHYVHGTEQPGRTQSGVGFGLGYRSPSGLWQVRGTYGYGIDAIRSHGRGANSVGILCQIDLEEVHHALTPIIDLTGPSKTRGLFQILQNIF